MTLLTLLLSLSSLTIDQCDDSVCSVELPRGGTVLVAQLPGMVEGGPVLFPAQADGFGAFLF